MTPLIRGHDLTPVNHVAQSTMYDVVLSVEVACYINSHTTPLSQASYASHMSLFAHGLITDATIWLVICQHLDPIAPSDDTIDHLIDRLMAHPYRR